MAGLLYPVVYLGGTEYSQIYISNKLLSWVKYVEIFSHIADKKAQAVFSGLTHSLHQKRYFNKHVYNRSYDPLLPLYHNLYTSFTPAIFGVDQVQ